MGLYAVLRAHLLAALGTAARENLATGTGGHTRTETVTALADKAAWLISAFCGHGLLSLCFYSLF
jgi:hypothetical protein